MNQSQLPLPQTVKCCSCGADLSFAPKNVIVTDYLAQWVWPAAVVMNPRTGAMKLVAVSVHCDDCVGLPVVQVVEFMAPDVAILHDVRTLRRINESRLWRGLSRN